MKKFEIFSIGCLLVFVVTLYSSSKRHDATTIMHLFIKPSKNLDLGKRNMSSYYNKHSWPTTDQSSNVTRHPPAYQTSVEAFKNRRKVILYWTNAFYRADFNFGFGQKPFLDAKCQVSNCEATNDRNRLGEADVVIFYLPEIRRGRYPKSIVPGFDAPPSKPGHQRWIYYNQESPVHTKAHLLQPMKHLFNWTMTYRLDSDIPIPYGRAKKIDTMVAKKEKFHFASNKTSLVAWFVSHSNTNSKRRDYVDQLQKYIKVDIYGKHEKLKCSIDPKLAKFDPVGSSHHCLEMASKKYKFYLALENSLCREYVTEKFWKILQLSMVPVVYGGSNYAAIAPPNSFIDIFDFPSPKHLADHLLKLDKDDALYNKYHEWKRDGSFDIEAYLEFDGKSIFCPLCAVLNDVDGLDGEMGRRVRGRRTSESRAQDKDNRLLQMLGVHRDSFNMKEPLSNFPLGSPSRPLGGRRSWYEDLTQWWDRDVDCVNGLPGGKLPYQEIKKIKKF